MPRITIHLGGREPLAAAISKASPLGALPTLALVRLGAGLELSGSAPALRALADTCAQAAELAEAYDADPQGYDQQERAQAERAPAPGEGG